MKISSKARYGIAAMIFLSEYGSKDVYIPILTISEKLGISKIYLEQVFSLLKRSELVVSIKGSQGGYQLSRESTAITAYDILYSIEVSLFEPTEKSVENKANDIEKAMNELLWTKLDSSVVTTLKNLTLDDLVRSARANRQDNFMFYI